MELSRNEERIMEGDEGPAKELAMKILVNLGELEGAERLIPVISAHISGVSYKTGGEGLIKMLERFHGDGAEVSVPSSLNPAGMDLENWKKMGIDPDFASKQRRIIDLYASLGVDTTCTCIPYELFFRIHKVGLGDHISWGESNAVIYANSMLGARTNREGSISCLASAITGRTPFYGMHLEKNRLPTMEVSVRGKISPLQHDLLGAYIGLNHNSSVPLIRGLGSSGVTDLKHMGATMAAKGGLALYHVEGVTPEVAKFNRSKLEGLSLERISLSGNELSRMKEDLYPDGGNEPDTFVIGCPQLGINGLERLNKALKGRRLIKGKRILAFSSRDLLQQVDGTVRSLMDAGVEIIKDTCMVVSPMEMMGIDRVGTDSGKAAHYLPKMGGISAELMPVEMFIEMSCRPR